MVKKFWGKKPAEMLALMLNTLKPKEVWENIWTKEKRKYTAYPGKGANWAKQDVSVGAEVVKVTDGWQVVCKEPEIFYQEIAVVCALCELWESSVRVRIFTGKDGQVWPEEHDVLGYIGKSTGEKPCFLLIHNTRSMGGGAILVESIMGIQTTKGKWLYKHPKFDVGEWEIKEVNGLLRTTHNVFHNGEMVAWYADKKKSKNYVSFMKGERFKI